MKPAFAALTAIFASHAAFADATNLAYRVESTNSALPYAISETHLGMGYGAFAERLANPVALRFHTPAPPRNGPPPVRRMPPAGLREPRGYVFQP